MQRFLILLLVAAALAGCTDDDGDASHDDECSHLDGDAHQECHEGQHGGEGGEGGNGGSGGNGTTNEEPVGTEEVTIRFTGTYPGTVTYNTNSVTVPANTTIVLEFCNDDNAANPFGDHDLVVEGIEGASTSVIDGGTCETIEFNSGPPQETKFYCAVGNHRAQGMEGDFIVE